MAGQLLSDWQVYQDNSFDVGPNRGRIVDRNGNQRIDCRTVERFNLAGALCHVHHGSLVPAPVPATTVSFSPTNVITIPLGSSRSITVLVQVNSPANLYGVKLQATYAPTTPLTVIDAWPNAPDLQIAPGSVFSNVPVIMVQNVVNPNTGVIQFEAKRQAPAPAFTGSGSLFVISWQRQALGPVTLSLNSLELTDPNGQILPALITGTIQIQSGFILEGQVELQGRGPGNGVLVTTGEQQTQTDSAGHFRVGVAGNYQLTLTKPGHLSVLAQGNPAAQSLPDAATLNLGQMTLPSGEVTGDDKVNIFDLAFIANASNNQNPLADLNGDGTVNIYDLALAAANYGQRGPILVQP
jgi:hypothetical protein